MKTISSPTWSTDAGWQVVGTVANWLITQLRLTGLTPLMDFLDLFDLRLACSIKFISVLADNSNNFAVIS